MPAAVQVEAADVAVSRIAASQRGVVTYRQLLAADLGRGAIAHRLATGRLHRLHRGVYLVGHPVPPPFALETAALLSCGDGAVLSHGSAAALWGFGARGSMIDVTISGRERGNLVGVRVHCVRVLSMTEVRRRHGLPVTSPARTLLDMAEEVSLAELERAVAEGRRLGLARDGELKRSSTARRGATA